MYLTFKFFHIIAIISWMAGILYLYRLFINHRENMDKGESVQVLLSGMERRLYKYITIPAMFVATIAGLAMIGLNTALLDSSWMAIKLLAVVFLIGWTYYGGMLMRRFAKPDENLPSAKVLRYMNEVPTLLMLIIVGMVIFRPWPA